MYEIEKCDKIVIPQGILYLGLSTTQQSVGYLELKPNTSLILHSRPAVEQLTQIKGSCNMVVYDTKNGKTVTLNEGDTLEISPIGTLHIHVNPFDKPSLTYWDFKGNIMDIIEDIRKGSK